MTEQTILEFQPMEPAAPAPFGAEEARRHFSRIGFALLAMALLHQFGGGIAAVLLGDALSSTWLQPVVSSLPLYLLGLPALLRILRKLEPLPPPVQEQRRVSPGMVLLLAFACYGAGIALNLAGKGLYGVLSAMKGSEVTDPLQGFLKDSSPGMVLLLTLMVAPLLEEYVFRGVLLKYVGAFGAKTYILFSAFTFALFHANLAQIPYTFVMGMVLAALTYYTGTIKYAVAAHLTVNFLGGGVSVIVRQFGSETVTAVFSCAALAIAGLGVIAGLAGGILLLAKRRKIAFQPPALQIPRGTAYRSGGVIWFTIVLGLFTVAVLLL